jgi:hypothetical protein
MQGKASSNKNEEDYDPMHLNKNIKFIRYRYQLIGQISINQPSF